LKRLLATGRHGFVGSTLARLLASEPALGWELVDVPHAFDIRDPARTEDLVASAAPDAVLHLAAIASVPDAFRDPEATIRVNVLGTLNLLQALKRARFGGPMLFVGTADVYGLVAETELPISERRLPAPRNPYAVSKLAAEALCYQWTVTEGIDIRLARPFNHIGPGQSDAYVVSSFARQIAAVLQGRREPVLDVGDIDVTRDFTDVRDVLRAYLLLLEHGASGELYNVCSGREQTVRQLVERLLDLARVEVQVREDPGRLRRAEHRRACGDPSKIRAATGWTATTPLDESLAAMLAHWAQHDQTGNQTE